jgi:hypothetical protein
MKIREKGSIHALPFKKYFFLLLMLYLFEVCSRTKSSWMASLKRLRGKGFFLFLLLKKVIKISNGDSGRKDREKHMWKHLGCYMLIAIDVCGA